MNNFKALYLVSGDSDSILFAMEGKSFSRISFVSRLMSLVCLASVSTTRKFAALNSSTCLDFTDSLKSMFYASISMRAGFASFYLNEDELSISFNANTASNPPRRLEKVALLF